MTARPAIIRSPRAANEPSASDDLIQPAAQQGRSFKEPPVRKPDSALTPEQAREQWTETLPLDMEAEDDLFYSCFRPGVIFIAAMLLGVVCFFILVATGAIPDPGLMP
jgi:hypothetical protein